MAEQLLIGDVTALTGIAPGRIRHYEKIGLLRADHLSNGYRVFDVEQVLDLLRIDLLRSLGVSIKDIQRLAHQTALADVLEEHRASLVAQRDRLDRLIAAIDAATDIADADVNECILQRLATSHRHSIGVIGRLSAPLSPATAAMYADLFDKWQLPVPALFGQMVLPPAASTLLEELAETPGRDVLFAGCANSLATSSRSAKTTPPQPSSPRPGSSSNWPTRCPTTWSLCCAASNRCLSTTP
ncbi:merR regulatory family protein [Mycobacterium xenopi 4042]|uniref:MerR regulatory family protein n=1 Tax=Mycobacterium xenopi 4042 TaxID=1299334 RepID=X8E2T3_MYCXE|nr:merR regulatory family protein [Mycobacterium xenopi 4042]